MGVLPVQPYHTNCIVQLQCAALCVAYTSSPFFFTLLLLKLLTNKIKIGLYSPVSSKAQAKGREKYREEHTLISLSSIPAVEQGDQDLIRLACDNID